MTRERSFTQSFTRKFLAAKLALWDLGTCQGCDARDLELPKRARGRRLCRRFCWAGARRQGWRSPRARRPAARKRGRLRGRRGYPWAASSLATSLPASPPAGRGPGAAQQDSQPTISWRASTGWQMRPPCLLRWRRACLCWDPLPTDGLLLHISAAPLRRVKSTGGSSGPLVLRT